jgi:cytochrome c-type biogenesis protein CcmH
VLGVAAACLTMAGIAVAQQASAQAPAATAPGATAGAMTAERLDALTREVASQLRCPVCQGESNQDSPSSLSQEMRAIVRQQLAEGRTPEQVKAYFVSKYGEWILLEPPASGFTGLVYLIPIVVLLAGIALVVVVVRRWTAAQAAPDAVNSATSSERPPSP